MVPGSIHSHPMDQSVIIWKLRSCKLLRLCRLLQGVSKAKGFKGISEDKLKFTVYWDAQTIIHLLWDGMDTFWNNTISRVNNMFLSNMSKLDISYYTSGLDHFIVM